MRLGRMNQRIIFQRSVSVGDGMGGQEVETTTVATVWASVALKKNKYDVVEAQQVSAESLYIFTIRFRDDLLPSDTILWRGAFYNIRTPFDGDHRAAFIEIEAERGVALQ